MTENDISKLLPDWTLSYVVSQSGNEKIYQAEKETASGTKYSLVKATFIPCFDDEFEMLKKEKGSEEELVKCNSKMLFDIKKEIPVIRAVCGKGGWLNIRESYDLSNANATQTLVVSRYDFASTVESFIHENGLTQGAIMKMGMDVCFGLEEIKKLDGMIHGSLTPELLFVDDNCKFRISKICPDISQSKSRKNIPEQALAFASPDIDGEELDFSSDTYSVGLIMYYYMNDRKLPFEEELSRQEAIAKRFSGQRVPKPAHDIEGLTPIVMKALSVNRKERFQTPYSMRKAIEEVYVRLQKSIEEEKIKERMRLKKLEMKSEEEIEKEKDISAKRSVETDEDDTKNENAKKSKGKNIYKTALLFVIIAVSFLFGAKFVRNSQNRNISKHNIHLASVYYKDTDKEEEFAFSYNYDGTAKEPPVVIDGLEDLVEGEDYTVNYENNVEVGKATIKVTGLGAYTGTNTRTFNIKPEKPGDVTGMTVEETGKDHVSLSWNSSDRADKYVLYRYDYDTQEWSDIEFIVDSSQRSIKITGLSENTTYKFSVKGAITYYDASNNEMKLETGKGVSLEVKTES